MPHAEDMPAIRDAFHSVPATTNPLGVKGVGEAATTGAIATIMNAIANAIPGERGARLAMPATPEKVWRACRGTRPDAHVDHSAARLQRSRHTGRWARGELKRPRPEPRNFACGTRP